MAVRGVTMFDSRMMYSKLQWGSATAMDVGTGMPEQVTPLSAPLLNGDTGSPAVVGNFILANAQITGTPGAGFSFSWEGSNDGGNTWTAIGAALTAVGALVTLFGGTTAPPEMLRPHVTAGDGTTSINAFVNLVGPRG